jgi:hypothetical protein
MSSLEFFLATTVHHFTLLPTIVISHAEDEWVVAIEWLGFAAGVGMR